MHKRNILDAGGFYKGDHVEGDLPENWTADLVGDGFYKARYDGGVKDSQTGEWTGGEWVETRGPTEEEKAAALRAAFVSDRNIQMQSLTVVVDGHVFDADEASQGRMLRAQTVMSDTDVTNWVLHDNTLIEADKALLLRALDAASKAQSALWAMPDDYKPN